MVTRGLYNAYTRRKWHGESVFIRKLVLYYLLEGIHLSSLSQYTLTWLTLLIPSGSIVIVRAPESTPLIFSFNFKIFNSIREGKPCSAILIRVAGAREATKSLGARRRSLLHVAPPPPPPQRTGRHISNKTFQMPPFYSFLLIMSNINLCDITESITPCSRPRRMEGGWPYGVCFHAVGFLSSSLVPSGYIDINTF